MKNLRLFSVLVLAAVAFTGCGSNSPQVSTDGKTDAPDSGGNSTKAIKLLNVSYDPTREFYAEFNQSFAEFWKKEKGQEVTIEQSHNGSGKQARAVIDGLKADVVTFAVAQDIDSIAEKGLLDPNWQQEFEHNSSPYTSTIVFLVRKGNPKQIKDWDDLARPGIEVITPNPKTSGGARWNYLAAWGFALKKELGDLQKVKSVDAQTLSAAHAKAQQFVKQIYSNVAVLDTGARGSTNTFIQNGIGDVLITWENEAHLAVNDLGKGGYEFVTPSLSILAEPPVAVIAKVAAKKGTTEVAKAYLQYLYSPTGQQIAAKHYYRPAVKGSVAEEDLKHFSQLELFTVDELFGGWTQAQKEHFDANGTFDQIYEVK